MTRDDIDIRGLRLVLLDMCNYAAGTIAKVDAGVERLLVLFGITQVTDEEE